MGWRMLRWWGLSPGLDMASVYRQLHQGWRAQFNNLIWWPTKQFNLNASALSADSMSNFITRFNRTNPKLLHGYVGAIDHLASFIDSTESTISAPKAIWVTSSPMSNVERKRIEETFRAPVWVLRDLLVVRSVSRTGCIAYVLRYAKDRIR